MPFNAQKYFDKSWSSHSKESVENQAIFKKAALMYNFDIEKDFSDFKQSDLESLKYRAFQKVDGKYTLPDDLRNTIINHIGINQIAEEINKNNIKTDFSETLIKNLKNPNTDFKNLSDSELFYSTKVADILPYQLDTNQLQSELQRRQFFIPFEKITQNFAGRRKELDRISDYVDWLPKEGLLNQAKGIFRNIIRWHEKPPMLIHGIGGIGKSTLVSKFILEQNSENGGKILPFVYIDFDLPGFTLKEPLTILIESMRQLGIQFPKQNAVFERVRMLIDEMIYNKNAKEDESNHSKFQSTTSNTRGIVYDSIESLIYEYDYDLDQIKTPILIVFDSFEEMQYRASRTELNSFFTFIREISDKIPRIRPIFVGRSEVAERLGDFDFDKVPLTEFDKEATIALLKKYEVNDNKLVEKIYDSFGGNPLLLQLAADLVKKDLQSINDFEKIKNKKHEYLVNRILGHIHDPDVRSIAVPGMLIRAITPEIIKEVLAEPCKLGKIDDEKAQKIFEELQKEAALISKSFDMREIVFRQDLRMACESMIWEKYASEASEIQEKAIEYYEKRRTINAEYEAELYYHLLKKGNIPKDLDRESYNQTRTYLESAVKEFPEKSQLYINSLLGSRISDAIIDNSSIIEFENYYLPQIKTALNGELDSLKKLYKEINQRKERSEDPNSEFPIYEALLCQRLNKLNESNQIIDMTIQLIDSNFKGKKSLINPVIGELLLIKTQNLEYNKSYVTANEFAELNLLMYANKREIVEFLHLRTSKRKSKDFSYKYNPFNSVFHSDIDFINTNWNYIASKQLSGQISSVQTALAGISSPKIYWVMSGNDTDLTINDPNNPKIFCLGNTPTKSHVYGAALSVYTSTMMKMIYKHKSMKCGFFIDELPTMYLLGLDDFIATVRSYKIATWLGIQDIEQLTKSYGQESANVIINTCGTLFSGSVNAKTAETFSRMFGKTNQNRVDASLSKEDINLSFGTNMQELVPASKIMTLSQGNFIGKVADTFEQPIDLKLFKSFIQVETEELKKERKELPLKFFGTDDELQKAVQENYLKIKADVQKIIDYESDKLV